MDVPSVFLGTRLLAEVRDAHFAHVGTLHAGEWLPVSPGLYHVSTVLDDGRRHSKVVAVAAGSESVVRFAESAASSVDSARAVASPPSAAGVVGPGDAFDEASERDYASADFVEADYAADGGWSPSRSGARQGDEALVSGRGHGPSWTIESISGAKMIWRKQDTGIFVAAREVPAEVPCLRMRVQGKERCISLPVNWYGHTEDERACTVDLINHPHGAEPRVLIPRDRNVSSALQHMVAHGQLFQAHDLSVEAADLLLHKYRDPVGAALGALVLYQTGVLKEHRQWLENLTRDFPWLPDGKILSAALALQEGEETRAAEHLLAAAAQRPMFTLSFSLMIDAMRRWNRPHAREAIQGALERWSDKTADVDWLAFTLTLRGTEGQLEEGNVEGT